MKLIKNLFSKLCYNNKGTRKIKDFQKHPNKKIYFSFQSNNTKYIQTFNFIPWPNLMEGYHNLSPYTWGKTFTDWFTKCYDGYIVSIWQKFIHFCLPLNPGIHKMDNSPNIICPRCREQDEPHTRFIFHCQLSKTTLDFISGLINLN